MNGSLARKLLLFGGGETPRVEQDIGDQTTAGSTSDTATFAAATTTGNGIIVTFALKSGARVSTLSDNKGNTYARLGFAVDASDAVVEMWHCQPIVGGASHQLTVTYNTTAYCVWGAIEANRVQGGAWYDNRTLATKTLSGGSSASPFITSGVPRASNELFVAALALAGGGADAGIATPAGWLEVAKFNDFDSVMAGHTAYKTQPTAQAVSAQWPNSTTTDPAAMIIAGFRGTGAVSGGTAKPVNTVAPSVSGTTTEGETLTVTPGTFTGTVDTRTYQWLADDVAISGATATTYVLTASEVGATIKITETATNEGGSTSATSAGVGPVAAAGSLAFQMVGAETNALAFDFTDDFFQAPTGFYGSAYILDAGTPANDYDNSPELASGRLLSGAGVKRVIGPTGVLQYAPHNFCLQSEDISTTWANTNTTESVNSTTAPDGTATADSLLETTTNGGHVIWQNAATLPIATASGVSVFARYAVRLKGLNRTRGTLLVANTGFTGWIQACYDFAGAQVAQAPAVGGAGFSATGSSASITALGNDWFLCEMIFETPATALRLEVRTDNGSGTDAISSTYAGNTSNGLYVWGAELNMAPVDTSRYIRTTTAAQYGLAYDWNGAGALQGILVEPARTNLSDWSEAISDTTQTNMTISSNTVAAPDGYTVADTMTCGAGSSQAHYCGDTALSAITSGNTIAYSMFMKQGTHRYAFLRIGSTVADHYATAVFDLGAANSAATETLVGGTSGTIVYTKQELVGNGWYRLSLVASATYAANAPSFGFGFAAAATGNSVNTSGLVTIASTAGTETMYWWGDQIEDAASVSSYIRTNASSVSRTADAPTIATTRYPHSATVNTAWIRYRPTHVTTAQLALRWDDGTANEVVSVGHDASANIGMTVTDGGAAQTAPLTSGTAARDTWEKIAVSWKANDFLLSDNGATAAADTSGTLPTVTSLDIGPTLFGHISQILVLPVEKTAAEVEALATP